MRLFLQNCWIALLLCCMPALVNAQAIYDADALSKDIKAGNKNSAILKALAKYVPEAKNTDDVFKAYKNNPYIQPYLVKIRLKNNTLASNSDKRALGIAGAAMSGLGLPGSTFIVGLTDFLVRRTKQELNIAFFREFQTKVKKSEELRYLFPSTSNVLIKIDENIYQFNAFWEVLRESFIKDLDNLVLNLDDYVQNSSRVNNEVQRQTMSDFFKVVELLNEQTQATDVIQYLAQDAYLHTLTTADDSTGMITTLQNNLMFLGLMSKSLEHSDQNGYWVDPQKIQHLIRDSVYTDMYLGLLYQSGAHIDLNGQPLTARLAAIHGKNQKIRYFLNTAKSFLDKADRIHRIAKDIRRKQSERRRNKNHQITPAEKTMQYDEYYQFTQGICDLFLYSHEFKSELIGSTTKQDSVVNLTLTIIGDINDIGLSVRKKQYTSALISTLFVIEKILPQDEFQCQRQQLLKYGTFIATAVNAKTAKDVSHAIEAFALPPGGSAIKKYSKFSIALNAYVGISSGQEILNNVGAKTYYAVAAPLGVSFSKGLKQYGSISLFASILDVGAVTAFRFQDDQVNELPDLEIQNVLAPGGYLVYGLPRYPIAVGFGAQLGPHIRSVNVNNITTTNGWRWGAFIGVDLPLANFYSNNKKYKTCR